MSCAGSGPSALARTGPRGPAFRADDGPMLALQKNGARSRCRGWVVGRTSGPWKN